MEETRRGVQSNDRLNTLRPYDHAEIFETYDRIYSAELELLLGEHVSWPGTYSMFSRSPIARYMRSIQEKSNTMSLTLYLMIWRNVQGRFIFTNS